MRALARIGGFVAALAVVFGLAAVLGAWVGPEEDPAPVAHEGDDHSAAGPVHVGSDHLPGGLMVSQNGYTFALERSTAAAGDDVEVRFRIIGPDGGPVTDYALQHEKRLHLIAVRRDFAGFQHVHPERDAVGTWTTRLDLTAGQWRLFADFRASGAEALTLGADLTVPGDVRPPRGHDVARVAEVDGYTVRLVGDLEPGSESTLTVTVERDGRRVADLEPYLGALGHLVALRAGDLAYLHVDPEDGPAPEFVTAVPSAGRYHLYLDFKHAGVVRTAAFVLDAGDGGDPAEGGDGHGH